MITSIAQVALLVRDYDEAIAFYLGKLGFRVIEDTRLKDKRWVRLKAPGEGGSEILLSRASDESQQRVVGNQAGGRVFLFLHTNDMDADYRRLRALGVEFTEEPREESYGRVAVLVDLYGNRIDLIHPASQV